jgi:outer membrane protein assembly factor BamB
LPAHFILFIAPVIFFQVVKVNPVRVHGKIMEEVPDQSKYVIAEDINKNTCSTIRSCVVLFHRRQQVYQWNPIIVDTIMYVLAKNSSLVALNAKTGKEIWIHANLRGITGRGINYWESKDRKIVGYFSK